MVVRGCGGGVQRWKKGDSYFASSTISRTVSSMGVSWDTLVQSGTVRNYLGTLLGMRCGLTDEYTKDR